MTSFPMFRKIANRATINSIFSERVTALIASAFAMWGILVIAEVEYFVAIKIVLVVATQVFTGAIVYLGVKKWAHRPLPELLGMGFAIGSVLSVVADQAFRTSSFRSIAWTLPFAGAVVFALIRTSKRGVSLQVTENVQANHELRTIIGIAVFSIIALTVVWNWMKFPAIGTFPILIYLFSGSTWPRYLKSRYLMIFGIASTCALGAYAVAIRPQYWWLPSWGIDENEIFAHSLYNWGPNDYALSAGIPLKYQWLSHAWMGLVTHISGAENFVLVSRGMFVITAFAVICLVWVLALRITGSARLALLATFIASASSTAISYPAAYSLMAIGYSSFALICMLSFFIAYIDWFKTPTMLCLILAIFLAISAIASKSVQTLAIGSGLAAVGLYDVWLTRKFKIIVGSFLICIATFFYAIMFFPSPKRTGLIRAPFASFTGEFATDPFTHSVKTRLFVTTTVLVSLLSVSLIGAIGILRNPIHRYVGVFLIGAFGTGVPMAVFTRLVLASQMHFIQIPIMLGTVPAIAWCVGFFFDHSASWGKRKIVFAVLLVFSFLAFPSALIGRMIVSNGLIADNQFTFFTNEVSAAVFVVTSLIGACAYLVRKRRSRSRFPIEFFVTACLMVSSVSMFLTSWETNPLRGLNETGATYQLGQQDLQEATSWAQRNTDINAIFASNSFFGENVDDRCGESLNALRGQVTDEATKTNYFTTAVALKRRLIAAGVFYTFRQSGDPTERVRLSILFACYPDAPSLRDLQDFGVTWFLAYRNTIDLTLWSNVGKVRFSNDHYAVIELNKLG